MPIDKMGLRSSLNKFDDSSRDTSDKRMRRHILNYNRPSCDHSIFPDMARTYYSSIRRDPYPAIYCDIVPPVGDRTLSFKPDFRQIVSAG